LELLRDDGDQDTHAVVDDIGINGNEMFLSLDTQYSNRAAEACVAFILLLPAAANCSW
jgi:hypothetical protein